MLLVPERSPVAILGSIVGAFCAGPLLGIVVAQWTSPGSQLAQLTSPLAFALIFAGGLALWFGVGFVSVVARSCTDCCAGAGDRVGGPRAAGLRGLPSARPGAA